MKLLIMGHGNHGKDTVAAIMAKLLGITFESSSRAALDAIWPVLSYVTECEDKEVAFSNRANHRELWRRLISLYNAADRTALVRKILEGTDCYVGMRCPLEYEATEHLFDFVVWVDSTERLGTVEASMGIEYDPLTMYYVGNDGTLEELEENARFVADDIKRRIQAVQELQGYLAHTIDIEG